MKNASLTNPALVAAALLCVTVFQNCTRELPDAYPEKGHVNAYIENDNPQQTRTALGEGNTVLWQEGDCISILYPANLKYTLESGAGTRNATFSGSSIDKSDGYYALYPYKEGAVTLENDTRVSIPWSGGTQTAVKGGFDPRSAVMLGYSNQEDISFGQVLSYIKFTTDFPCTKVRFYASHDVEICATKIITALDSDGKPKIISTEEGGSVIILQGDGGSVIEPGTYLIAVLPTTLTGFSISFETTDGSWAEVFKSTSQSVTLKRAGILNLGTINASIYALYDEWHGEGTATHPYLISTKTHLELLQSRLSGSEAATYASCNYFLTNDIDYERGTLAIGGATEFKGTFDGGGNSITNVRPGTYTSSTGYGDHTDGKCSFTAIFPRLNNATIKNLGVVLDNTETCYSMSSTAKYAIYGGIAGFATSSTKNRTTISGCTLSAGTQYSGADEIQISGNTYVVWGGILGDNGGHLECNNCTSDIDVRLMPDHNYSSQTHCAGGIIGKVESETKNTENFHITVSVDRCRNKGNLAIQGMVDGEAMSGGIIAYVYEDTGIPDTNLGMTSCVNGGEITASGNNLNGKSYAGGLIGKHDSDGGASDPWIYNSLNRGYVKAYGSSSWSGGIMGWCYNDYTKVICSANVGQVVNGNAAESISGGKSSDFCANDNGVFTYSKTRSDSPTSIVMNAWRSNIPAVSGRVYAGWTGSGDSLDLVL